MKKFKVLLVSLLFVVFVFSFSTSCKQPEETKPVFKLATVMPGSIQDADYNTIGYIATQEIGNEFGIDTAYSEKIAVPDVERVIKEYISDGYNIIWVHGNQFNGAALEVANEYPDVTFIIEVDSKPTDMKPNVWYFHRNFHTGFYVLGSLAALKTETGKIGYLGGLEMPFTHGEINAIKQAIKDLGLNVNLEYVYAGDMNDPLKARQAAESLISRGVDVILSSVNLGNYGIYNALADADRPVYITVKYTDKYSQAPQNYLTADLFDFKVPLREVVGRVLKGEKGGFLMLEYGEGKARYAQFPIKNVTDEINNRVKQIADDVASGKIQVIEKLDVIDP
ncbi:MAG TPA: BMP family protein [Caldisericia bacterium]|nr:BMP family protein [Caldisericia bacterium]HOL82459.1 BMP family protein [Caldisericia bacterium]HON83572.1 BMP family protein [Caldisericia bacterium]HPC56672.1 BMP family protein [Caldisericia bacterium]HPP43406.1 BMP family protein [Caldisericia bacterium]